MHDKQYSTPYRITQQQNLNLTPHEPSPNRTPYHLLVLLYTTHYSRKITVNQITRHLRTRLDSVHNTRHKGVLFFLQYLFFSIILTLMATLSGFITQSSVLYRNGLCRKPLQILDYSNVIVKKKFMSHKKKFGFLSLEISHGEIKCESISGRNQQGLKYGYDELNEDPYWVVLTKQYIGGMKSLARFLLEQPTQLKYIEWPSFWSTLKTATLTLVLVGLLIIALSSVDSGLSYVLALLMRKSA